MKLYISGPMTGYPEYNYPAFMEAEKTLLAAGYDVSNPAQYPADESVTWAQCLKRDLVDMLQCDAVATLPDWEPSRGAQLEVRTAKAVGMPVAGIGYWLSMKGSGK